MTWELVGPVEKGLYSTNTTHPLEPNTYWAALDEPDRPGEGEGAPRRDLSQVTSRSGSSSEFPLLALTYGTLLFSLLQPPPLIDHLHRHTNPPTLHIFSKPPFPSLLSSSPQNPASLLSSATLPPLSWVFLIPQFEALFFLVPLSPTFNQRPWRQKLTEEQTRLERE